ncbi:MAG: hypothetical protein EON61_20060 [Alphaproteobacteria bacterium]|nr:MAG: hypothetical protein EON61_20060 [Alphaproteobacteria bacterium]
MSARRAASGGAYLISTRVSPSHISSVGMGESAPTATNDTVGGRAINRCVEVTILDQTAKLTSREQASLSRPSAWAGAGMDETSNTFVATRRLPT